VGKLKFKLILSLVLSLALSTGLFILLQIISESILDNYLFRTSFIQNQQEDAIADFQNYVTQNELMVNDQESMKNWVRDVKYVNIFIFKDGNLLFATDGYEAVAESREYLFDTVLKDEPFYDVAFADMNAKVYMECFFEYKYYYTVAIINAAVCFLSFIILMLLFINRKTSYISTLEHEIKILEGGDLSYPITIKGNDELSSLAQSINEMRGSFIERLDNEDSAKTANRELVTAMSHDLRTPLTALVGYLDIITLEKYKTHEDLMKYIRSSRDKAYQIKLLSDKLFEYFTVFKTDEDDLQFEWFNGNQLIEQLIDEQLLNLQNNGLHFQLDTCGTPYDLKAHLISIRRVFDNVFSNILKYADKSKPVTIHAVLEEQHLVIRIENHMNADLNRTSGTGIGLKTCERILESHYGHFSAVRSHEIFTVSIRLKAQNVLGHS
jgi:signal transduction histidine kinase